MAEKQEVLTFQYSDRWSTIMLWWKAVFLVPIWAYPALPFIGSVVTFFGIGALRLGNLVIVVAALLYFIQDVLKRKCRIEDRFIVHGFRSRDLSKLVSIGTDYKQTEVLPKKIVLTFSDGTNLPLKLSRLTSGDFQRLLRHVETKYPQCKIDPVLPTLINCKKLGRKVLVDDSDKFIIEYKSGQQIYKNLWQAFLTTLSPWLRIGPLFVAFFAAPLWLSSIGYWFFTALPDFNLKREAGNADAALGGFVSNISSSLYNDASSAATSLFNVISNPFIALTCCGLLLAMMIYAVRALCKANSLLIDKDSVSLKLALSGYSIMVDRMRWHDISSVDLVRTENGQGKIRFQKTDSKPFFLDLTSISGVDRPRLVRALERFAPGCTVDSALSEAMLPRHERSYTELWLQSLSTPPERNSLQALVPGQRLQHDQFTVLKRLGVGGQGTAYLCRDELSKKNVVLKETVIPVYADRAIKEQALKRFEQEAKILQSLDSDGIVKLLDYFFEDHRGYLVLEHVDARNLRQVVGEQGSLGEKQVLDLARQMCTVLAYLHERKIVHRDFTPDNLMLSSDGRLKLIDFNVAQAQQVGTTGTIAGKHAYLPPEQFRGKAGSQSDIYAMGATLQFLLTGHDPEAISQSSPLQSMAQVSEELDSLVRDCTAIDCSKRCESVEAIEKRLLRIASGEGERELQLQAEALFSTMSQQQDEHKNIESSYHDEGGKDSIDLKSSSEPHMVLAERTKDQTRKEVKEG